MFALKSIKIPVQKHSFLTETYSDLNDPQEAIELIERKGWGIATREKAVADARLRG